jgi:hypothetical protein
MHTRTQTIPVSDATCWCSGNVLERCLVRISVGTILFSPKFFVVLAPFLQANDRTVSQLHHELFLPNPFEFILPFDDIYRYISI